ncbi:hypothetical protein [Vreelandella janggokensis]|uniref:hypothetical protein n=1 Tax=Vreelandella janggokensis TaxID=370767 RepID=UPI00285EA75C|nr:hypothetical protein [Halomonas janggokensis]MDR5887520.1 hypothetical protein [Halomonas janggokensis]
MSEYTQGVCDDGAAILKDGQQLSIEQILEALRERDEYHSHLATISEMTGNKGDIGAAHEGVNVVIEDLGRHKRMFVAACESLGEIQKSLGNEIVGIEPQLVKELVEERDALAAHVERLQEALRGSLLLVENDLVPALEGAGELDEDIGEWKAAMYESPATSLARRDAIKQAEALELVKFQSGPHEDTPQEDGFDAGWDAAFDLLGQRAKELRQHAEGHQ